MMAQKRGAEAHILKEAGASNPRDSDRKRQGIT